jgi:hypothetical protein
VVRGLMVFRFRERDSNPLPILRKGKTGKHVTETGQETLAYSLAHDPQIDPDLARLIDAWPKLPEALRAGILGIIDAARKGA